MSHDPAKDQLMRSDYCCWMEELGAAEALGPGAAEDFKRRNPPPPLPTKTEKEDPNKRGF